MRARDSKRLVIDTDVVQSSGDEDATDPRAIHCRDFLSDNFGTFVRILGAVANHTYPTGELIEWKVECFCPMSYTLALIVEFC